jgi:hypothetical protein
MNEVFDASTIALRALWMDEIWRKNSDSIVQEFEKETLRRAPDIPGWKGAPRDGNLAIVAGK